jgi:hypothetical protein
VSISLFLLSQLFCERVQSVVVDTSLSETIDIIKITCSRFQLKDQLCVFVILQGADVIFCNVFCLQKSVI